MIFQYIFCNLFFRNYEGVRPEVLKRRALEGLEAMKMKCEHGLRGWKIEEPAWFRNFLEILRAIDSMQLTAKHKVATPANWKKGEDVVILPAIKDDEAKKIYPDGWETVKPYLRKVPDPSK